MRVRVLNTCTYFVLTFNWVILDSCHVVEPKYMYDHMQDMYIVSLAQVGLALVAVR
jgi:hypothetical protein